MVTVVPSGGFKLYYTLLRRSYLLLNNKQWEMLRLVGRVKMKTDKVDNE